MKIVSTLSKPAIRVLIGENREPVHRVGVELNIMLIYKTLNLGVKSKNLRSK